MEEDLQIYRKARDRQETGARKPGRDLQSRYTLSLLRAASATQIQKRPATCYPTHFLNCFQKKPEDRKEGTVETFKDRTKKPDASDSFRISRQQESKVYIWLEKGGRLLKDPQICLCSLFTALVKVYWCVQNN